MWRDLSTTAVLRVGGTQQGTATSHGPRVIPPGAQYDTARYGDRPFPVVPVAYYDRDYQTSNTGAELSDKINSPSLPGSTFNLFQEMSLGQLFPEGTVPSADIATAPFSGDERVHRPRAVRHLQGRDLRREPRGRTRLTAVHRAHPGRHLPAARPDGVLRLGQDRQRRGRVVDRRGRAGRHRLRRAARPASSSTTPPRSPTRRSTTPTTTPTRTASSTSSWSCSPAAAATAPRSSASPGCAYTDAPLRQRLAALLVAGVLLHRPRDRAGRLRHRRPAA